MQPRLTSMSCFVHLWRLQMTNEPLKLKSGVKQSVSGIRCVFQKRLLMAELPLGLKAKIWDSWMMFNWSFQNTQELTPINPPTHSDIHTHAEETCMLKCTQTRHQPVLLFFFSLRAILSWFYGGQTALRRSQKTRTWKCCFRFPSKPMKDLEQINLTNNLKWEARPAALMVEEVGKWIKDWRKLSLWVTETN